MPRENKKRGRRAFEKDRRQIGLNANDLPVNPAKRRRLSPTPEDATTTIDSTAGHQGEGADFIALEEPSEDLPIGVIDGNEDLPHAPRPGQQPDFYGFLTQEEQDYYGNVIAKLDANDFTSQEDRSLFIDAVHRESQGKELKIASSQSSSRHLERILSESTRAQIKGLFSKLLGHLGSLVCHRFASHVVETVFVRSAVHIGADEDKDEKSLDDLFLEAAQELRPDIGYLMTEKFATHVVRTLILILLGESPSSEAAQALRGKKTHGTDQQRHALDQIRQPSVSFQDTVRELSAGATAGLDTSFLRALATSATGNPVLQLLLRFELVQNNKQQLSDKSSLLRRLFPDQTFESDTDTNKLILSLSYDSTGSRLIEVLLKYAPGKLFKQIYRNVLLPKLTDMARNDIASHVISTALERLSKGDLETAILQLAPDIPANARGNRLGVLKTLVERAGVREVDPRTLLEALTSAYGDDPADRLTTMLRYDSESETSGAKAVKQDKAVEDSAKTQATDIHGSLLAQSILNTPNLCTFLHNSLLNLSDSLLLTFSRDKAATHVIQQALTSSHSPQSFLRQFTRRLQPHVATLTIDPIGSHVIDALWTATSQFQFLKDSIASDLVAHEMVIRESRHGRLVWRNWAMDLYLRRPNEWRALAKDEGKGNGEEQAVNGVEGNHASNGDTTMAPKIKTPIERARDRHLAKSRRQQRFVAAEA